LSEQYKVHPNQIGQWRLELLERAAEVFATAAEKRDAGPNVKTRCTPSSGSWPWRTIFSTARSIRTFITVHSYQTQRLL